jgi:4-amino-4-deoxy-L-arabinose transferase-like glycosyltransferase
MPESNVRAPQCQPQAPDFGNPNGQCRRWYFEPEIILLALLVIGVYFVRLESLTIRGEETRRATIAREMVQTGDWIVPRQQGAPFLSRPPLQNWAMATVGLIRGGIDEFAVRLPSAIAVLLTTLLIYGYSRSFLNRLGSLAAASAFATFGQILELGRLGESDAMLTLFVSASLLVWHWGWMSGRSAVWCWIAGYGLAGLGTLVKGPQAPVYFAAPVAVYLILNGQWRQLLRWPHFVGMAAFAAVVGAWLVPFFARMGFDGIFGLFTSDIEYRFEDNRLITFFRHLAEFPIEIIFGGLLPWSPLLVAFLDPKFRRALGAARPHVRFIATVIAITFPTVWLVPGAETRLYVSIFPMFAVLVGLVVQRCFESVPVGLWEKLWRPFVIVMTLLMAGVAIASAGTSWMDPSVSPFIQPVGFAVVGMLATALGGALIWWSLRTPALRRGQAAVLVVAVFTSLMYAGAITNVRINQSQNAAQVIAQLKDQLPDGSHMVSFGPVHHLFNFYYDEPIELLPWPEKADEVSPDVEYFCFEASPTHSNLPLSWVKVAEISCHRSRGEEHGPTVIVGRYVPGQWPLQHVSR